MIKKILPLAIALLLSKSIDSSNALKVEYRKSIQQIDETPFLQDFVDTTDLSTAQNPIIIQNSPYQQNINQKEQRETLQKSIQKIEINIKKSQDAMAFHQNHIQELQDVINSQHLKNQVQLQKVIKSTQKHVSDLQNHISQGQKLLNDKNQQLNKIIQQEEKLVEHENKLYSQSQLSNIENKVQENVLAKKDAEKKPKKVEQKKEEIVLKPRDNPKDKDRKKKREIKKEKQNQKKILKQKEKNQVQELKTFMKKNFENQLSNIDQQFKHLKRQLTKTETLHKQTFKSADRAVEKLSKTI